MAATFIGELGSHPQKVDVAGHDHAPGISCVLQVSLIARAEHIHVESGADVDVPPPHSRNDPRIDALVGMETQRHEKPYALALLRP